MKKIILILLALVLFCSCKISEAPAEPEIPEIPESSPAEEIPAELPEEKEEPKGIQMPEKQEYEFTKPEIICFPTPFEEGFEDSAAFAAAMERPSVILYNGYVISTVSAAEEFIEKSKKGEYAELYIYDFSFRKIYDSGSCYYNELVSSEGKIYHRNDLFLWNETEGSDYVYPVKEVSINEHGYLLIEYYGPMDTVTFRVENVYPEEKREVFEEMERKYLEPIEHFIVLGGSWGDVSELDPIIAFEFLFSYENGKSPWEEYGNYWPAEDILSLLGKYFDGVSRDIFKEYRKYEYDAKTDCYYYEGGLGGVPPEVKITEFCEENGSAVIYYELYNGDYGHTYDNGYMALRIRLNADGSFTYLSLREEKPSGK